MTSAGAGPVASKVLIIDISDFESRKQEIAQQLYSTAKDVGFFYIRGHGIPQEEIELAFAAGQRFYDLPERVKQQFSWIPDRYLGWRSQSDLETVTGLSLIFMHRITASPGGPGSDSRGLQVTSFGSGSASEDTAQVAMMSASRQENDCRHPFHC